MVNLSTGLRAAMLGDIGLAQALEFGAIHLYTGTQPAAADDAVPPGVVRIGTISKDGAAWVAGSTANGISVVGTSTVPFVDKETADWEGTAEAEGTIGWFRFVGNETDAGAASLALPRMDGSVGVAGANLNLANINCVVGTPLVITSFRYTLPKS